MGTASVKECQVTAFPYERGRGTAAPAGLKAAVEEVVETLEFTKIFEYKLSHHLSHRSDGFACCGPPTPQSGRVGLATRRNFFHPLYVSALQCMGVLFGAEV